MKISEEKQIHFLSSISFLVKVPLETFGRVDKIAKIIETTLNISIINVGTIKCEFVGLSNFGIKVDKAIEIIIAFTESKILALLSAIWLNFV